MDASVSPLFQKIIHNIFVTVFTSLEEQSVGSSGSKIDGILDRSTVESTQYGLYSRKIALKVQQISIQLSKEPRFSYLRTCLLEDTKSFQTLGFLFISSRSED